MWRRSVHSPASISAATQERCADILHAIGIAVTPGHPCQTLALRLRRHRGELFEFVREPDLEAINNEAECWLRPLVIAREISGGTRSPQDTQTHLDLDSLFQTKDAQDRNPFAACYAVLYSS